MPDLRLFHAVNPLPPGKRAWAYAVGAVYHVAHGFAADGIDPLRTDDFQQAMLSRDWGIGDRGELVAQLSQLGAEGHRFSNAARLRYYAMQWRPAIASMREELRASIREGGEDAEQSAGNLWRLDAVQADLRGIRSSSLLAFDAARGVMLARAGMMLGWLSEEEGWAYLVDLARDVQRSYPSWAAYGADFLLSRNVWRGNAQPDAFDTTVEMLTSDPASPWLSIPWGMELAMGRHRSAAADEPAWTLERR